MIPPDQLAKQPPFVLARDALDHEAGRVAHPRAVAGCACLAPRTTEIAPFVQTLVRANRIPPVRSSNSLNMQVLDNLIPQRCRVALRKNCQRSLATIWPTANWRETGDRHPDEDSTSPEPPYFVNAAAGDLYLLAPQQRQSTRAPLLPNATDACDGEAPAPGEAPTCGATRSRRPLRRSR
jgi:hypothetical protein